MNNRFILLISMFLILTTNALFSQSNFWEKIGVIADSSANAIYITNDGDIWVGSGETSNGGAVFLSTDDGDNWTSPYNAGGPGVSSLLIIDDDNILIGTGTGLTGVIKLTTDAGANWSTVHTFGMFELVTSFASTPAGIFVSSGVYQSTSGKILFSGDGGSTWSQKTGTLGAIMALKATSTGELIAGNHNGDVFISNDDGDTWTQIRTGANKDIGSIEINSSGHIYIGVEGEGVYRTTNGGTSWTQLNNGMGNKQVSAILLVNDNLFFAGTPGDGVYRSVNAGSSWNDVTRGLGYDNVGGGALKIYNNYLYCGVGNGVYKSIREATDIPEPPSPPKNLDATNGARIVTLAWEESDSAGTNVVYRIYRRTSETSFTLRKDSINSSQTSYVDSVRNNVQYYYYMTSFDYDKALESDQTSQVSGRSTVVDPVPPDAPTNLTGTPGNATVTLRWNAVQATPVKYSVFRSTTSNQYGTALATAITSTSYSDNSVTNETRYYYIVKAVNDTSSLSSNASNEISVLPVKPNPEPVTNIQAAADYPNINVWWTESTSGDVTEYRVYRSTTEGTGYELAGTETAPSNTFVDNTAVEDVTYYYIVKAWDDVHESQSSGEASAMVVKLRLNIVVLPETKITADRLDNVVYNIITTDQSGTRISADVEINNGVTGGTNNAQTDANGAFRYEFQIPSDQVFAEYSMSFTATKTDYEPDETDRILEVAPIPRASNDWAKVYSEDGIPKLIFAMVDTNNKWFSPGEPGKVKNNGFDIVVDDFLYFSGDITLDTNNLEIVSNGKWFVNLPSVPPLEYSLLNGDVNGSYTSGTLTLQHNESNMQLASSMFGVKIYPSEISFIGGLYASGITVDGYFYLNGTLGDCDNQTKEIYFTNLIFDANGINVGYIGLPSLSLDPTACFSNLQAAYDQISDKLTLYGNFTIPWLSVRSWGEVQGGILGDLTLFSASGEASAIGETGMSIRNVSGLVTGVSNPPMGMTLNGTVVSASPDFFEFDIGGIVHFPQQIGFNASQVRMILEHTYGQWQIVGPMTGMMNVTSHVDLKGSIRAGTIEGQNYVLEGEGQLKYHWKPEEILRGAVKGDVKVVDFPDEFPYDMIEMLWEDEFPVTLKNAEVFVQDRKIRGNLHFGNLIGSLNFTLDLDKVYGQEGFLVVGSGAQNLNGMLRKDWEKDEQVQNYNPLKFEGQSLPMLQRKKEGTQAITNNDTLNLTGGMDKVFIRIMSDTQVPGSYLVDPNGTKHDADDDPPKDTNVVFKESVNGKKGYWIVKGEFPSGQWIAGSDPDETGPGDYRDVFATFEKRDIELSITKNENDITAEWNNIGVQAGPYLEFYLGLDTNDVNGLLVGTADENVGQFNYTLADTLPDCLYYLYVIRFEGDKIDRYYSTEELWNNKGNLMPPDLSSSVYYGGAKKMVVSWTDPNTIDNVQGYLIRLTYTDGTEEIIARPYAGETNIEIDIDIDVVANPTLEIALAAFTDKGYQSCWSTLQGVTVDVEDYPFAGFENGEDRMSIFPNPVDEITNIRFKVFENENIKIIIYDLLGNELEVLADDYYSAGIYDLKFKTEKFLSGTYFMKYQAGDYSKTKLMIINK